MRSCIVLNIYEINEKSIEKEIKWEGEKDTWNSEKLSSKIYFQTKQICTKDPYIGWKEHLKFWEVFIKNMFQNKTNMYKRSIYTSLNFPASILTRIQQESILL